MFGEAKTNSDELETVDPDIDEARTSNKPTPEARGGGLLTTVGVLLVLGGVALAALPKLAPNYAWAVKSVTQHGLSVGLIVLSGIVLFGLGRIARQVSKGNAATDQNSDDMLMLEHLIVDFTKLRDGVQDLRLEIAQVRETNTTILQATTSLSESKNSEGSQDAMFRMAASLDQVGARIEHRLGTQSTTIQDTLAELSNAILATHTLVSEIVAATSNAGAPSASLDLGPQPRVRTPARGIPQSEPVRDSELDVWVELDVDEGRPLGVLDTLDDLGQTRKTSPSVERPRALEFAGPPPIQRREQPGPLPQNSRSPGSSASLLGREAGDGVRSIPLANHREVPVGEKIDQLKSLLSDARVRKALELMQGES